MDKLELRPYQAESVEALREGFRKGHVRQVLCAPTGAGKSRVMEHMIRAAMDKGSRIMFICERRVLVEQFSAHLDRAGIDHGVLMAKHWRFRPHMQVQIASAQTLERMDSLPAVDLIFIDELHAAMRASIVKLLQNNPNLRVIGATATPFNPLIGKYFSSVTSVTTMAALVHSGHLVPFRVFAAKEIDTAGVKIIAGEWQKDELEGRGRQIVGDVVTDYIKISNAVFGGPRKTICFSCGIAHGAELAQKFNEHGINAVQISSEDNDEYKAEVLREFAKPDTPVRVLISVAILSRGFDQSDVDHVILARPLKKSFSEHVQMIGRGARPHPGKSFCVLQDHTNNYLRFLDDWEELYSDGVTTLDGGKDKKPKKEPTAAQKDAAKCPRCSCLWGNGSTCANCGFERVKRNAVTASPGDMQELLGRPMKVNNVTKQQFYSELLGYADGRGYKEGWVAHRYREKFEVWPRGMVEVMKPPTQDTLNFIRSRNIAYKWASKNGKN